MARITILTLVGILSFYGNTSVAVESPEQQLQQVDSKLKDLSSSIEENRTQRDRLYRSLRKQSRAVSKLGRQLHRITKEIKNKNQQLNQLELRQEQFKVTHAKQIEALKTQLKSAYFAMQPHYLKVLLNEQSPTSLSRSASYFHYFHQARQAQIKAIALQLKDLDYQRNDLLIARQQQQQLYQQQRQQQKALSQENQKIKTISDKLDEILSQQGQELLALEDQQTRLTELLVSVAKDQRLKIEQAEPFVKLKGRLLWPVQGPIVASFNSSRELGKLRWQGIMIQASIGSDIVAAADGEIVFSDWLRGFGLLIIIDHGDKYMTLYGNNQSLIKSVGERVRAGEVIALSGKQGVQRNAGLYFELRHNGAPTNPKKWLGRNRNS